jgi:hypothetical protein
MICQSKATEGNCWKSSKDIAIAVWGRARVWMLRTVLGEGQGCGCFARFWVKGKGVEGFAGFWVKGKGVDASHGFG